MNFDDNESCIIKVRMVSFVLHVEHQRTHIGYRRILVEPLTLRFIPLEQLCGMN